MKGGLAAPGLWCGDNFLIDQLIGGPADRSLKVPGDPGVDQVLPGVDLCFLVCFDLALCN